MTSYEYTAAAERVLAGGGQDYGDRLRARIEAGDESLLATREVRIEGELVERVECFVTDYGTVAVWDGVVDVLNSPRFAVSPECR